MSCFEGGSQIYHILEPLGVSALCTTMARIIWESLILEVMKEFSWATLCRVVPTRCTTGDY